MKGGTVADVLSQASNTSNLLEADQNHSEKRSTRLFILHTQSHLNACMRYYELGLQQSLIAARHDFLGRQGLSSYHLYHQIQDFITQTLSRAIRAINSSGGTDSHELEMSPSFVEVLDCGFLLASAMAGFCRLLEAPLLAVANRIVIRPTSSLSPNSIIWLCCQPPASTILLECIKAAFQYSRTLTAFLHQLVVPCLLCAFTVQEAM